MYQVDLANGRLMPQGYAQAGSGPVSITLHPDGQFAYVVNSLAQAIASRSVSMFTVSADRSLRPEGTVAAGKETELLAVDATGQLLFAANYGSNNVSVYKINAQNGKLTLQQTVDTGDRPTWIVTTSVPQSSPNWTGWSELPDDGLTKAEPAAVVFQDTLSVIVQGVDYCIYNNLFTGG
jgi:hypothetical protein